MRGRFSRRAEVVDRGDETLTEQPQPDPVREDAGGEGILWRGRPLGKLEPAARVGGDRFLVARLYHLEKAAGNAPVGRIFLLAANEDLRVERLAALAHPHREEAWGAVLRVVEQLAFDEPDLSPRGEDASDETLRVVIAVAPRFGGLGLEILGGLVQHVALIFQVDQFSETQPRQGLRRGWQVDQIRGAAALLAVRGAVERLAAEENAGESVVVGHRNRIELVIVTTGARRRRAEKSLRHRVDLLVDEVEAELA